MSKNLEKFSPTHPGKIVERRFFKTRNLTVEKVAQDTRLPSYQLQELVEGKRDIDTDIAARLGIYFQVGAEGFLNLQQIYDLEIWKDRQEAVVKRIIRPYRKVKQHGRTKAV
ncbi:MAG: HigA family addiction module antidote protein [Candidatus Moeniiplasma glomeromycotorum]|nr:HigA family addiction module antidote protein [Candidatus Moeniiplasma glomeromycotorum]MCE8167829.1 HigA family addiction module antidote protein [Candidatus Moeniiplasma glomeromycotorum]MCE8169348.1 HigA family addiction module antidote protein [Candidatus Moeniiplasma glomeromycotorum]